MTRKRPFVGRGAHGVALIAAPFVLPHLGFSPTTINRILVWGLFGLGFDLLFGYAGLLSFGQSAFFGTGGMFAAYLMTDSQLSLRPDVDRSSARWSRASSAIWSG